MVRTCAVTSAKLAEIDDKLNSGGLTGEEHLCSLMSLQYTMEFVQLCFTQLLVRPPGKSNVDLGKHKF